MIIKRYNLICDSCGGFLDPVGDYDTKTQTLRAAAKQSWITRKSKLHFCCRLCLEEYEKKYTNSPRRPFKEWDVVQYQGIPFIVARREYKNGYVKLEGNVIAHYTALTLLLPSEKAKKNRP